MNTLICAGGSATRILEAVVHLCAAGLGPERLRVLQIDPDQSNGNGSRVRGLLETYAALHGAFAGRLGPHKLFATQIEDLGSWSPCAPGDTLAKVLRFDVLDKDARDVARLLFTEGERELTLDQGFRGHTPIGAAAMSLVRLSRTSDVDEIADSMWRTLAIVYALFAVMALSNSDADSRLAVLGGGPNVFGRNMAILGLICVDAIVRGRARALAIVGVSVAGMLVLLSGSRGAMLAITSGVALVTILLRILSSWSLMGSRLIGCRNRW